MEILYVVIVNSPIGLIIILFVLLGFIEFSNGKRAQTLCELFDYLVFFHPSLNVVFYLWFCVDSDVMRIECLGMCDINFLYLVLIDDFFGFEQTFEVCWVVHEEGRGGSDDVVTSE